MEDEVTANSSYVEAEAQKNDSDHRSTFTSALALQLAQPTTW
jgi:hypothetical protein